MEKKEGTAPSVPKLAKGLHPPKWLESFKMHCRNIIGALGMLIYYIMIPNVVVAMTAPPLTIDQPCSKEHGSLEDELIAQSSHTHALYKSDNQDVHQLAERAIRENWDYVAMIAPFVQTKNGRDATMAMASQYAGKDIWENSIKNAEDFIQNQKWSGTTSTCFLTHAAQH